MLNCKLYVLVCVLLPHFDDNLISHKSCLNGQQFLRVGSNWQPSCCLRHIGFESEKVVKSTFKSAQKSKFTQKSTQSLFIHSKKYSKKGLKKYFPSKSTKKNYYSKKQLKKVTFHRITQIRRKEMCYISNITQLFADVTYIKYSYQIHINLVKTCNTAPGSKNPWPPPSVPTDSHSQRGLFQPETKNVKPPKHLLIIITPKIIIIRLTPS